MELCKKQKIFSQLSAGSVKFNFSFQDFEKEYGHSACFSGIIDRKERRYLNN